MDYKTNLSKKDAIIEALQQKNLVYNSNFLYFSNKKNISSSIEYGSPDGWLYSDEGANSQIYYSDNCCRIVVNSDGKMMCLKQSLHEFPSWKTYLLSRDVTMEVCLFLDKNTDITISLSDGLGCIEKTIHTDNKGEYCLSVTMNVNQLAEELVCSLKSDTKNAIIIIQYICANVGLVAIPTLPPIIQGVIGERKQYIATDNPPAEELSLCNEPIELSVNQSRLDTVINGKFGKGPNGRSLLPDMRGYFSRAWNNGAAIDPDAKDRKILGKGSLSGDNVGTQQDDQFKTHTHDIAFDNNGQIPAGNLSPLSSVSPATCATKETGGKETRSKNITELFTIKWA